MSFASLSRYLKIWAILAVMVSPTFPAASASERWAGLSDTVFENLTVDNGLPHKNAMAVSEDGDGFLWVGTIEGLARWDGYRFRIYQQELGNPDSLPDSVIRCLHQDKRGRLWIGTGIGGLALYDRDRDRFKTFAAGPEGLSDAQINALADDGGEGIWVGTDGGLDHLDPDSGMITRYRAADHRREDPADGHIRSLLLDRSGVLWVGGSNGLARLRPGSSTFESVPILPAKEAKLRVDALFEDQEGWIWIGTRDAGAYSLDPNNGVIHAVRETDGASSELGTEWIRGITEATPGIIWLGTIDAGIVTVDKATGETHRLTRTPARASSLADNILNALYRDRSGLVWAGTESGLSRYDPGQTSIMTLFGGTGRTGGITDAPVQSVLAAKDGRIWLGLFPSGVDILDPSGGKSAGLRSDPSKPDRALPRDTVFGLAQTAKGDVFLATARGLYRADSAGRQVSRIPLAPENPSMGLFALFADKQTLWVGAMSDGLWKLDLATGAATRKYGDGRLTDQRIGAVIAASDGKLWVGTDHGLNLIDPVKDEVEKILPDPADPSSLSAEAVSTLLIDGQGRLWAGTENGGINILESRDDQSRPRFRRITKAQGLPNNTIGRLLQDQAGKIWASTNNGFAVIDPETYAVRAFGRPDGAAIPNHYETTGDVSSRGEMLFGGYGGLTIIRPDEQRNWDYRPPLVVTDIAIGGKQIPAGALNGTENSASLILKPDGNRITVEFSALDFSAPDHNRYAYRLEGYDSDWTATDWTRRSASYSNLPPGNYLLRLRGSNRTGAGPDSERAIPVQVLPAWHQTIWAKLAAVLAAMSAIFLIVHSRTVYLRLRQRELESQIAARTAQLSRSNEALVERHVQVASLLDHSGEGFLSFGPDLIIHSEYSRACEQMLGCRPAGQEAAEILFGDDQEKAELFRNGITKAISELNPHKQGMILSLLLPQTLVQDDRILAAHYKIVSHDRVMVVLHDVTEERRLSDLVKEEHQRLQMIVYATTEGGPFFDLVDSYRHFIEVGLNEATGRPAPAVDILIDIQRQTHTFKGNLSQFSFIHSPPMLHQLENRLLALKPDVRALQPGLLAETIGTGDLQHALESDLAILRDVLGQDFLNLRRNLRVAPERVKAVRDLAAGLSRQESPEALKAGLAELIAEIDRFDEFTLRDALARFEPAVMDIATRLGKKMAPFVLVGGEDVWLEPTGYAGFLRALVHVFRNAVAHGIEPPEARAAAGKDVHGQITCTVAADEKSVRMTIADDGGGIDLEALRLQAARFYPDQAPDSIADGDLIEMIFADLVTTREAADDISGRGIGLAAVRQEVTALGGSMTAQSVRGQGATFTIVLPRLRGTGQPS